jgi:hypothetical protein
MWQGIEKVLSTKPRQCWCSFILGVCGRWSSLLHSNEKQWGGFAPCPCTCVIVRKKQNKIKWWVSGDCPYWGVCLGSTCLPRQRKHRTVTRAGWGTDQVTPLFPFLRSFLSIFVCSSICLRSARTILSSTYLTYPPHVSSSIMLLVTGAYLLSLCSHGSSVWKSCPVQFLGFRVMERDQDRSINIPGPQKTGLNCKRLQKTGKNRTRPVFWV